jgi:diguanylate cyclase (GGDEF)-like protein
VYNRRYIGEAIEAELVRCGRYAKALSVVVIDLDDFGAFNTQYGQSMGDRLLRSAAVSLAEAISPPEIVARLKDDEFAVLLPETNRAAAVSVTTRLLASLSQVSVFGQDGSPEPLKASVAIVCFPEDGTSSKDLLDSAAADLEQAKRERVEEAKIQATRPVNPLARAANERPR